ncbi:MAG: hypothetical protein PVF56_20295 [Desulfobacterales bacterium]
MKVQVSLTVPEAKRIIAKGIAALPEVQRAFKSGKIFLKGGTTVSAVCEELTGKPLLIAGRISPQGAMMANNFSGKFHCALIENGELRAVDEILEETAASLKSEDVAIFGANAIDVYGDTALMYGVALGGKPAKIISGIMSEISHIIVAVGLEKLIPGSVNDIILKTGRKDVDASLGMAVGLTPIVGRVMTEKEAITVLGEVDCTVIGKGGISGAEGGTTMHIEGQKDDVQKILRTIQAVKGISESGIPESLPDCVAPHEKCKVHKGCIYKKQKADRFVPANGSRPKK